VSSIIFGNNKDKAQPYKQGSLCSRSLGQLLGQLVLRRVEGDICHRKPIPSVSYKANFSIGKCEAALKRASCTQKR
jgi:hypothetical protein